MADGAGPTKKGIGTMNARLMLLLALAVGLAVYFAVRTPATPASGADEGQTFAGDRSEDQVREMQTPLRARPLAGPTPDVEPELSIRVEVDPSGKKNRIYYYIKESNGFYVEEFQIDFYYKPEPDTEKQDSPLIIPLVVQNYLKAGETFEGCTEVVSAEMKHIEGDMGSDENWAAEITSHGRYRAKNPEKMPLLPEVAKCQ